MTLFDLTTGKVTSTFNHHTSSVKGISYSPLNKLLLTSVSLDKYIIFYDVAQKSKVSNIKTEFPLSCISFNVDGSTVAVGTKQSGIVMIYDLRNNSQPVAYLEGHKSTINSISFKNYESSKSKTTP